MIRRNIRLFFKDKGMFLSSLITPVILLVLYVTFLSNVYRDSFTSAMPPSFAADGSLINAFVGGQLVSSLLAVSCVTVSFCSNLLMIGDKTTGAISDLKVSPVRRSTLALGYFISSATVTMIISFAALVCGLAYLSSQGWYISSGELFCLIADVILLTLLGTALSSCVNFWLSTNGQASAVGTIVSAGYGFVCGAYMPISQFSDGLQKAMMFLPGTYGTGLFRNHAMNGAFREMTAKGVPDEAITALKDAVDCNMYFFGRKVETAQMYLITAGAVVLFTAIYVLINVLTKNSKKK